MGPWGEALMSNRNSPKDFVLCSISLDNFDRDESISLLLRILILVKTDMNVLAENCFQWIGNCLF